MARRDPVRRAKRQALEALEVEPWFVGLGITRVDAEPALLLSVRKSARRKAERALARLDLEVRVVVREVERIRALAPEQKDGSGDAPDRDALYEAVRRRS